MPAELWMEKNKSQFNLWCLISTEMETDWSESSEVHKVFSRTRSCTDAPTSCRLSIRTDIWAEQKISSYFCDLNFDHVHHHHNSNTTTTTTNYYYYHNNNNKKSQLWDKTL